ncbi:hypothetical protein BGZ76_007615 [Entomortierella beljakovae]|nr:hypothetical protein BGZ76_007615 [Entomortierella beljakovae]
MTCYKNTQCVPTKYLCDIDSSCTDSDGDQDPDNPIYCQNQLCAPKDFLPFPSPGFGKMNNSVSDCQEGNYYSLFGSTPKYTRTCVEPYQDTPVHCQSWEYAYQSSCFFSTCGPGLDCVRPFECVRLNDMDLHGVCINPNGKSGSQGGIYSQRPKSSLVQGIIIGICSLILGIGLGVGYWHYKRRRSQRDHIDSDQPTLTNSSKGSSWFSRFFSFRKSKSRNTTSRTMDRTSTQDSRDSIIDSESTNGSFVNMGRSTNVISGRWRWPQGTGRFNFNRSVAPNGLGIYPEIEPPPMYHVEPDLPSYVNTIEEIDMTNVHHVATNSDQQHQSPENRRASNNSVGTIRNFDNGESLRTSITISHSLVERQQGEEGPSVSLVSENIVPSSTMPNSPSRLSNLSTQSETTHHTTRKSS